MKRTIIKIDEDLCNGCGLCVEGCHEGALQLIDGKARMISDLYCDGLGACIGDCPVGAITLEEREAEPYDEIKVMQKITPKGEATIIAHLNHLIDHDQMEFFELGIRYIKEKKLKVNLSKIKTHKNEEKMNNKVHESPFSGGCPGSKMVFSTTQQDINSSTNNSEQTSELRQWPVQLHLVNPQAPYFQNADVLLAADCVAFSMGNFHSKYLKGKGLAIACPKLDSGKDVYLEKLIAMINNSNVNTLTVIMMEVPCCTGLLQIAKMATEQAERKIPVKALIVGIDGKVKKEEWV